MTAGKRKTAYRQKITGYCIIAGKIPPDFGLPLPPKSVPLRNENRLPPKKTRHILVYRFRKNRNRQNRENRQLPKNFPCMAIPPGLYLPEKPLPTTILIIFYPPCTSRKTVQEGRRLSWSRLRFFSIRKTLISDHFDKLVFPLNEKFADDVIFSEADTLTGCPLDANIIIMLRALDLSSARYVTRNVGGDEHDLFVVDGDFSIVCTRYACGRPYSIFFCCSGFGLHTHLL